VVDDLAAALPAAGVVAGAADEVAFVGVAALPIVEVVWQLDVGGAG